MKITVAAIAAAEGFNDQVVRPIRSKLKGTRSFLKDSSPLEFTHTVWLLVWGLSVLVSANYADFAYNETYAWSTIAGVKGAVGMVALGLGLIELGLFYADTKTMRYARLIPQVTSVVWWGACLLFFFKYRGDITAIPNYGSAVVLAIFLFLEERKSSGGTAHKDLGRPDDVELVGDGDSYVVGPKVLLELQRKREQG